MDHASSCAPSAKSLADRSRSASADAFIALIDDGDLAASGNMAGKVRNATSHLIPSRSLLAYAISEMERAARAARPA